ncbi:MAG: hypothetical protein NEHIOOID_01066 [Holosporales bacterium]
MTQVNIGGVSTNQLTLVVEKIERLEEEKLQLSEQIKEVFAEARADGFDVKTLRTVIKMRRMKPEDVNEQEELLDIYLQALGMRQREVEQ